MTVPPASRRRFSTTNCIWAASKAIKVRSTTRKKWLHELLMHVSRQNFMNVFAITLTSSGNHPRSQPVASQPSEDDTGPSRLSPELPRPDLYPGPIDTIPANMPELFDILLSDVDENLLHNEISTELGTPYLSDTPLTNSPSNRRWHRVWRSTPRHVLTCCQIPKPAIFQRSDRKSVV